MNVRLNAPSFLVRTIAVSAPDAPGEASSAIRGMHYALSRGSRPGLLLSPQLKTKSPNPKPLKPKP